MANTLLPYFKDRPIASIKRSDVEEWFAGVRSKPAAANLSASLLSVIMQTAEDVGVRPEDSNPLQGLRHYRLRMRERVLIPDEMARLGLCLVEDQCQNTSTYYICNQSKTTQFKYPSLTFDKYQ